MIPYKRLPKYNREELFSLLTHAENLQHQRVYYLLVAETIFFLAATTALEVPSLAIILAASGIAIAVFFTITTIRQQFRASWLITELNKTSLYNDYSSLNGFSEVKNVDSFTKYFMRWIYYSPGKKNALHILVSTSFIYTWVIFFILLATWILFICFAPKRVHQDGPSVTNSYYQFFDTASSAKAMHKSEEENNARENKTQNPEGRKR